MLHKSFKPAKCKTALKLAVSRIKLLKNKREAKLKQLKRELAQLLESGQDQTARIRVEHVVREEKTLAAYDLIEIYCELIVARLPMIESQKNCPIDLKEAVSSVIFASPKCADIPELMDVRKHFTAKYGKEFVTAAVELRPDCGASRLLVEKLSANAPDISTKIKVLSSIAEQHDVKWDPKSFGEKEMKPSEDLLNGPNTFAQASKMHMEPPNLQDPPGSNNRLPPDFGASSKYDEKHDAPANSYGSNSQLLHNQNNSFTNADASKAMPSSTSHPDRRPSGTPSESMEYRQSYASGQDSYSTGRQSWNMEFKDATAAAQAAAESAELASRAARVAAELSNQERISRQHSTESNKASLFRSTDEEFQNYASSRLEGEHIAKDPAHNTMHRSNSGMHYTQSLENQQDDLAALTERFINLKSSNRPVQSVSSKSSSIPAGDYPQVSDSQMADGHSRKTSLEFDKSDRLGGASMKREFSEAEAKFPGAAYNEWRSANVGYFEDSSVGKQPYSMPGDDLDVASSFNQRKFSEKIFIEPFIFDEEKIQRNAQETHSHDNGVVFDNSDSDDDLYKSDMKGQHNGQDSHSNFWSDSRKSSSHLLENSGDKSPRLNMEGSLGKSSSGMPYASECHSASVFSEAPRSDSVPSQANDLLPAAFDESDGPGSDSEEELNMGSALSEKQNVGSSRNTWMQQSTVDSGVQVDSLRNQEIEIGDETDRKLNSDRSHRNQTSHRHLKSQSEFNDDVNSHISGFSLVTDDFRGTQSLNTSEDKEPVKESSLGSGTELNYGNLTGGLRNRGYKYPPYRRNPVEKHSVSKTAEDNSTRVGQSSSLKFDVGSGADDQKVHLQLNKELSSGNNFPHSDARDESDEEHPQHTFYSSQEPYAQKPRTEMNKKSGLGSYFDSENSDSEEEDPKQTVASITHSAPAFSRRTKITLSNAGRNSKVPPEPTRTTDYVAEKKSSSVSSYATENPVKSSSQTNSSDHRGRSEQSWPPEQDTPMPISQSKTLSEGSKSSFSSVTRQNPSSPSKSFEQRRSAESSKSVFESTKSSQEKNPKVSALEQASNPSHRKVASGGPESTASSNSHGNAPSRENSINKAGHVHPKLPDYDTLTAHLLSLRQNQQ